jgi:transcriptional regulator with XRE-family HTH domain
VKTIGIQEVRISKLVLPGYFNKLPLDTSVQDLARNIEAHGLLHEPVVVRATMRPIYGIKRIAAVSLLGRQTIDVKLVELEEGDDEKAIRMASNVPYVSTSVQVPREEFEHLFDAKLAEVVAANPGIRVSGGGRTRSAMGIAREELAAQLGVTPSTVKRRARRIANKPPQVIPPPKVPLETMDLPLDPTWLAEVAVIRGRYDLAIAATIKALAALKPLTDLPAIAIRESLHGTLANLRQAAPRSVCQWCKCVPPVQAECARCAGLGWVGADLPVMPPHLMDTVNYQVNYRGKAVALKDLMQEDEFRPIDPDEDEGPQFGDDHRANEPDWSVCPDEYVPDPDPNNGAEIEDWMGELDR